MPTALPCAVSASAPAGLPAAGADRHQVGPIAGQIRGDARRRTIADGEEGDHGRHADDDAEHRQEGAELVAPEAGEGDAHALPQVHSDTPVVTRVALAAARRVSSSASS